MPGPVSDSFDPEWATSSNAQLIRDALDEVYQEVSRILGDKPPIYILELVDPSERIYDDVRPIPAALPERTWRLIRFALERAGESI